jgi:PAS domain-containing protein
MEMGAWAGESGQSLGLLAEFDEQADRAMQSWHSMQFTARFLDEAQPAGPRTYIGVVRLLNIAIDNQEAFQSLITTRGVTHWSHWNLLRSVFEASFCAIWVLDPNDSRERRRRGLRLEILDSKEQRNWIDSLKHVGVDEEASDANTQWQAGATRVYKSEADALGLNWVRANQPVNLV